MKLKTQIVILTLVIVAGAGWYFRNSLPFIGESNTEQTAAAPARGGGQAIPVEAAKVRVQELATIVEAVGTATANEAVTITAKGAGIVRFIGFQEGQKVAAGAVLVELDNGENRAKIQEMRANQENIQQSYDRAKLLLQSQAMARSKADDLEKQLEAAEAKLKAEQVKFSDTVLRAPFAGKLGVRQMSLGSLVKPGDVITTLDDISMIKLEFQVPETVLSDVKPGQTVAAISAAYPNRKFEGTVSIVDTRIDPVTRSVLVRASIPNNDEALRPGMFLTVQLATARKADALLVPEESIIAQGGRQFVFAINEGRAQRTKILVGRRLAGQVEVTEGLTSDSQVIVAGLQKVRDGAPVRIVGAPGTQTGGDPTKPAS